MGRNSYVKLLGDEKRAIELWRVQQSFQLEVRDHTPFLTEVGTARHVPLLCSSGDTRARRPLSTIKQSYVSCVVTFLSMTARTGPNYSAQELR
jgi:hypothetical protein